MPSVGVAIGMDRFRPVFLIVMLWAAGLGAAAQFGKISVGYQALELAYAGHTGQGVAVMVSIVGIVGLIFGTTAGLVVARIGARRAVLSALVLGAGVSLLQSNLPAYPLMMLARVLEGFSHLAIVVVGPTAIAAAASPARQGAAMTLWSSFFGLTYAVLAWVGPGIIAQHGLQGLFQMHGVWMLACALILWHLMPNDVAPPVITGEAGIFTQHLAIYASPRVSAPAMGFVCYTVTYVAVLTLLPPALSPGWGQFAAVSMPLISITVSLTLGVWLLSRITAVRLVQLGFCATVLATLALSTLWGQGLYEVSAALVLAASLGIVQGASFASIPQLNDSVTDRTRAAGAVAQLGNLGTTTGTPLLVFLMGRAGETGLAQFLIGFSVLGVVIHAVLARRRLNAELARPQPPNH
jgi:DHA1 family inner membrane transport protein